MRVTDISASATRFKQRAAAAQGDYAAGVRAAGADWQARTAESEDNYVAGVQAAVGRKAFSRGVQEAGSAKYVERAAGIGAGRFAQGVANADAAWQAGSRPYLEMLKGVTLPPKGPKGSPQNFNRVAVVANALRALKTGEARS